MRVLLLLLGLLPLLPVNADEVLQARNWRQFETLSKQQIEKDRIEGISYLIAGSLTTIGGLVGSYQVSDPAEKLTYTVFQNIGIASLGFGFSRWKVGNESRRFFETVNRTKGLTTRQRSELLRQFKFQRGQQLIEERRMRLIVHSALAVVNVAAALRESNQTVKNGLLFIGGINSFAAVSFAWDF